MANDRLTMREVFHLALLSLAAVIAGLQVLVIIGIVYSRIPLNTGLDNLILVEWLGTFYPSRNLFLYRLLVCIVLFFQAAAFLIFAKKIKAAAFIQSLKKFVVVESFVLAVSFWGLFQIFYHGDSSLGKYIIGFAIFLMAVTKLFRAVVFRLADRAGLLFSLDKNIDLLSRCADYFFPFVIFLIVYIPDRTMAMAKILQYDNLYHFDGVIMGAAWASLKGLVLNMDVISQYGIGMPIVIGRLSWLWGGFSYENVLAVLNVLTIICLILGYFLLRIWLKDPFLAMAGILASIILRLYSQSSPFIWAYPNGVIASRYLFEAAFFILLLLCLRNSRFWLKAATGFIVGCSLFYVVDTGLYLLATYYCYLVVSFVKERYYPSGSAKKQSVAGWVACFLLPFAVAFVSLWAVTGSAIFRDVFWNNCFEFTELFLSGLGATPASVYLKQKDFVGIFLALAMFLEYLLTIAVVGKLCFARKIAWENILAVLLSIYGLCLFNYFICRPGAAYYRAVSFPFIVVTCYWISKGLRFNPYPFKEKVTVILAGAVFVILITCRSFIDYPHLFHIYSGNDAVSVKDIKDNLLSPVDIALIDKLTVPGERVCLFSDFETMVLMEADRPPFFYCFPMVHSAPRKSSTFGGIYLLTQKHLRRTLGQLEGSRPKFVFIDRKLISELPAAYYLQERSFSLLLLYLSKNYDRFLEGKSLIVFKRKTR
ncbi:MAG TPA: hypothetical protein PK790_02740 [Candidatus Omnitrophota bacterium]|nr:hypothetical protein [Candidatus Omnitrophota bacterium]